MKFIKYSDREWEERNDEGTFNKNDIFNLDYYYWNLVDDKDFKKKVNISSIGKENNNISYELYLYHNNRKKVTWQISFQKMTKLFSERFYVTAIRRSPKTAHLQYGWLDKLEKRFSFHIRKLAEAIDLYDNNDEIFKTKALVEIKNYSGFKKDYF